MPACGNGFPLLVTEQAFYIIVLVSIEASWIELGDLRLMGRKGVVPVSGLLPVLSEIADRG